jgi:hypothetical protein
MYDNDGNLNAIFFVSRSEQQDFGNNQWGMSYKKAINFSDLRRIY